jgi:rubrerythrin
MDHFKEFKTLFQKLNPTGKIDAGAEELLLTIYSDLQKFADSLESRKERINIQFKEVLANEIFYAGKYKFVKIDEGTGRVLEVLKEPESTAQESGFPDGLESFDTVEYHGTNLVDIDKRPG